jgi:hypothetical protein
MGVDAIQVDMDEETKRGGPYLLSLLQARMEVNMRPDYDLTFDPEWFTNVWSFRYADRIHLAFGSHLWHCNDEASRELWADSYWHQKWHVQAGRPRLLFSANTVLVVVAEAVMNRGSEKTKNLLDPKRQFGWCTEGHSVAEGFPYRSYIARAAVPAV